MTVCLHSYLLVVIGHIAGRGRLGLPCKVFRQVVVDPADVVLGLGGVSDHLLAQLGQDLGVADNVRLGPVERGGVLVDVPAGKIVDLAKGLIL